MTQLKETAKAIGMELFDAMLLGMEIRIKAQAAKFQEQIDQIRSHIERELRGGRPRKRVLSEEARERIAAAQRKRHARNRKAKSSGKRQRKAA